MSDQTPTPRTDAATFQLKEYPHVTGFVSRDFARQLERELAAALKERDQWKASHDNQVQLKRTLTDRPDLKERAGLVQGMAEQIAQLTMERDALKSQLEQQRREILAPSPCGVSGHFRFQLNGGNCMMCQHDAQLRAEVSALKADKERLRSALENWNKTYRETDCEYDDCESACRCADEAIARSYAIEQARATTGEGKEQA